MKSGSPRERDGRGTRAVPGALLTALGIVASLAAVAYAAAPGEGRDAGTDAGRPSASARLPGPKITQGPNKLATSTSARFAFTMRTRGLRFQCRLDGRAWRICRAPIVFTQLAPGDHAFSVRALDRQGRRGRATRFRWTLLEPKDFAIVPQLADLPRLFPGAAPVSLPLTIANPNPVPIRLTSLRVAATADPQGCASAANLELIDSSVSSARPLKVPAKGSVSLPAPGVSPPAIQLRNLPINQDACQGAQFPLAFTGTARG